MEHTIIDNYKNAKRRFDNMLVDLDKPQVDWNIYNDDEISIIEDNLVNAENALIDGAIKILSKQLNTDGLEAFNRLIGTDKHDRAMELVMALLRIHE